MILIDSLSLFSPLDAIGVVFLAFAWMGMSLWIEREGLARPSVTVLMVDYRRAWLHQFITREPRIFDAQILGSLRQGTSFFASGSMIAIGGVMALIGNTEPLRTAASGVTNDALPEILWQIKLLAVMLLLTNGFLKFMWANRLFGYCAVVMASVPNDITHPATKPRAAQAADINIRAAWNFNRGLRSIYFALGALAWLLGPAFLIAAVAFVSFTIWQREFSSVSRGILDTANDDDSGTV